MHTFVQRIAVYAMDNRMYRVKNACIYSAYCCLHNGQSNVQSTKCTYFIQHVAVCNGQPNVQDTKYTRLFSVLLYAMDNRMYRVQNAYIYSACYCLQWTTECTEYKMHAFCSVYCCLQWIMECTGKHTLFSLLLSAMDNGMHRRQTLFLINLNFIAFLSAMDNPMYRVGCATVVAT